MGVTLKEIAALAGVHRSTVDKVLHKRPGVSEEVRRRVQAVIDEPAESGGACAAKAVGRHSLGGDFARSRCKAIYGKRNPQGN